MDNFKGCSPARVEGTHDPANHVNKDNQQRARGGRDLSSRMSLTNTFSSKMEPAGSRGFKNRIDLLILTRSKIAKSTCGRVEVLKHNRRL